jgi:hypothetical protein
VSCRRAFEHDLPGFLADPRAAEHAEFRDHYPRCAECAAEVRAWTELAVALGAAAGAHPEPERLLRFADAREVLPRDERAALEAHLAGCAACRDELAALARFEPGALLAPARGDRAEGGLLAALRRALWHPAFAYALLLVLAVPAVYTLMRRDAVEERGELAMAQAPEREGVGPRQAGEPAPPALGKRSDAALERGAAALPAEPAPLAEAPAAPAAEPEAFADAQAERSREETATTAPAPEAARAMLAADDAAEADAPLRFERRAGGLAVLRLPVAAEGEHELRLVAPDGRTLVQRAAPTGGAVELVVAGSWLGVGPHRVEVHAPDGGLTVHSALPPAP